MGELIAFRALQGIGAGGLLPLSQAAIADLFSPRERGSYQGYIGSMWATAAVAGPLLGGTLTDAASWRWIFCINLPLAAFALVVVMRTMRAGGRTREHSIDWRGRGAAERRRLVRPARLRVGRDDLRVGLPARCSARPSIGVARRRWRSSASSAARRSRCSRSTLFRSRTFAVSTARRAGDRRGPVRDHDLRAGVHAGRAAARRRRAPAWC